MLPTKSSTDQVLPIMAETLNVLPQDQFFTMLLEHQSSIVNLEGKLKQMLKNKGLRNIGEEIDSIKHSIARKQTQEIEQALRAEIFKQDKEMERLKNEYRSMNEI